MYIYIYIYICICTCICIDILRLMIYMIHLRRLVVQLRISACDAFYFIFLSLHVLPPLPPHPLSSLLFLLIHSAPFSSSPSTHLPSLPPHPLIFLLFLPIHSSSFSSSPSTHLPSLPPHPLIFLLFDNWESIL